MRVKVSCFILVAFLATMIGCSQLGIGTPDWTQLTPKQKATFFMGIYNRQYDDYKMQAANPSLDDAQKKVLQQKKKVLIQIYPLIQTYDMAVAGGQPAGRELENAIMALLDQIQVQVK